MKIIGLLTAFSLVVAAPAVAAPQRLTVRGAVTGIAALQNGQTVATPAGAVKVGDAYTLQAVFDLSKAQLTSLFDADPTVNIYNLPGTRVAFSIGSFSRSFIPVFDFNATVQLWNNRDVVSPVDSQSFSFFDFDIQKATGVPFAVGAGMKSASVGFYAFDNTAAARTNDLISQIAPFSAFESQVFSYGLLNADSNLFVAVNGSVASASLDALPEPGAWLMMLSGFGALGAATRRRRKIVGHA